jgi:hypothetical protein
VRYEPYEAMSSLGSWERSLDPTEAPLSLATGSSFVAVATDAGAVHTFDSGGTHMTSISLPGPPVALAARGPCLVVTCHRSSPTPEGNQCLDFMVRLQCCACSDPSQIPFIIFVVTIRLDFQQNLFCRKKKKKVLKHWLLRAPGSPAMRGPVLRWCKLHAVQRFLRATEYHGNP